MLTTDYELLTNIKHKDEVTKYEKHTKVRNNPTLHPLNLGGGGRGVIAFCISRLNNETTHFYRHKFAGKNKETAERIPGTARYLAGTLD